MAANLGRCRRLDKIYSRARDRSELLRTVDEELGGSLDLPTIAREHHENETSLAQPMMNPEDPDATPPKD